MDLTGITLDVVQNFISNLGFPIFMCLYFMYSQRKAENRHDRVLEELKCIQSQQLETKLQTAQVIHQAAAIPAPTEEGKQP
jgi:hypothetical protein